MSSADCARFPGTSHPRGGGTGRAARAQSGSSLIALPPSMSCQRSTLETMSNVTAPIVLIHGLWLSADSWRGWVDRYRSAGHVVHAPDWPADPGIGLAEAIDHFDAFVRSLPDAADHHRPFDGRADHPVAARPRTRPSRSRHCAVEAARRAAGSAVDVAFDHGRCCAIPRNRRRAVPISPAHFHYVFANTISRDESDRWHAELAIPAPGRVHLRCGGR